MQNTSVQLVILFCALKLVDIVFLANKLWSNNNYANKQGTPRLHEGLLNNNLYQYNEHREQTWSRRACAALTTAG